MFDWPAKSDRVLTFDAAQSAKKGGIQFLHMPRVIIDPREFARLQTFIDLYDKEIAGLGSVIERPNGDLFIERIFLVDQIGNTGSHVDISDGVMQLMVEMDARGESPERLRCRWHSHVNMAALFSNVDEDAAKGFGGDYLIDIVGNKRGEFDVRLYFRAPVPVVIGNMPLLLDYKLPGEVVASCRAEIKKHVKNPVITAVRQAFGFGRKSSPPGYEYPPYASELPPYTAAPTFVPRRPTPPAQDFGQPPQQTTGDTELPPPLPPVDKTGESMVESPVDADLNDIEEVTDVTTEA